MTNIPEPDTAAAPVPDDWMVVVWDNSSNYYAIPHSRMSDWIAHISECDELECSLPMPFWATFVGNNRYGQKDIVIH